MRVQIKTKGSVKDNGVKALYLIEEAMKFSSPHMKKANIKFIADKHKINLS